MSEVPRHPGPALAAVCAATPTAASATLAEIDQSLRVPFLVMAAFAAFWLADASIVLLLASVKLHAATLLSGVDWLTYGRIRPTAINELLYGFASQAGLAVALWVLCRLGRVRLQHPLVVTAAALFWNLGLAIGTVGILVGHSTGFEWLEIPRYVSPILLCSYAVIAVCALLTFTARVEGPLFVSQWYLLAALFWFPWLYSTALVLLVFVPVRGVMQTAVNQWYVAGLVNLWLTPLGLAAVFYFTPKLAGRPLASRQLAVLGFWALALFGGFTGSHPSAPLPAWMNSVGTAFSLLMLVPVASVAVNWNRTLTGCFRRVKEDAALGLITLGMVAYLLAALMSVVGSFRPMSLLTEFTYFSTAQTQMLLLGFLALVFTGAIYHIAPRLLEAEFPSRVLMQTHWMAGTAGTLISALALSVGGVAQGAAMQSPFVAFHGSVSTTMPFLHANALGMTLVFVSALAFLVNFGWLLLRSARAVCRTWMQQGFAPAAIYLARPPAQRTTRAPVENAATRAAPRLKKRKR